ncbi:MAG: Xaa-Pro peptidase family protein [Candidatus Caldarchaeales archaeon]
MFFHRINKVRRLMESLNLDTIMLTSEPNMLYISGYSGISLERLISLLILRGHDRIFLIIPKLEERRAEENCRLEDIELVSYSDVEDPLNIIKEIFSRHRLVNIGVEGVTPFRFIHPLLNKMPNLKISIIDDLMYSLRIVKDSQEIDDMKRAAEINNRLMVEAIQELRPGISEKSFMAFIKNTAFELGADDVPFALVQSGINSALPHQEPTSKIIEKDDIVVLDIGVRYGGYYSDITRTIVCGRPSSRHLEIFNIVLNAQQNSLNSIRQGVRAEEIDMCARRIIESAGYGEYFIHRTGHGIGLEVHEPPYIKIGNTQSLEEGMAFTVEPGIYLPGKFGVRIEDNVIVKEEGCINLTSLDKSLNPDDYTL